MWIGPSPREKESVCTRERVRTKRPLALNRLRREKEEGKKPTRDVFANGKEKKDAVREALPISLWKRGARPHVKKKEERGTLEVGQDLRSHLGNIVERGKKKEPAAGECRGEGRGE